MTAPTALARCDISATTSSGRFPASGGSGTVAIVGERECTWALRSDAPWVRPAQPDGQGEAVVPFTVAANPTASGRHATLEVGGRRLEIAQDGADCRLEVEPSRLDVPATAGSARLAVVAPDGCGWTARTDDGWIRIERGSGSGRGTIELSMSSNPGGDRGGAVTVGERAVSIVQRAASAPAPPTPGPPPAAPAPAPPSPAPPTRVELEGRVSRLRGSCPQITFRVEGTSIVAGIATEYRDGSCRDVDERRRVSIVGVRQADGAVRAERITLRGRDDD